MITRRTSQSSKLSGYRSPDYSLSRRPQLGCDPAPLQKDDSTLRLAYSALELLRGQCRLTLWGTLDARRADVAPPGFSSIAAMYPVLARLRAAISGALSTRPNVDGVAGDSRSELLPSRDALGLSNRARRTPRSCGVASATVANVGRAHSGDEDPGFRRAACAHTGAVHGPVDPVSPRVAPA